MPPSFFFLLLPLSLLCYGIQDLCCPVKDRRSRGRGGGGGAGGGRSFLAAMIFWICAARIWTTAPPEPRRLLWYSGFVPPGFGRRGGRASQVENSGLFFYSWVCYYEQEVSGTQCRLRSAECTILFQYCAGAIMCGEVWRMNGRRGDVVMPRTRSDPSWNFQLQTPALFCRRLLNFLFMAAKFC